MKIIVLVVAVLTLALCLYVSQVFSHSSGATDTNCIQCHKPVTVADIKIAKLPKTFAPGKTYEMELTATSRIEGLGDRIGGFAIKASHGKLIAVDKKNTQVENGFLMNTTEGAASRKWKIAWESPVEGKDVTLTVSVITANGDSSPGGDAFMSMDYIISPEKQERR